MRDRYLSLQILRAVAAWMVVYHHFMQIYFDFKSEHWLGEFFSRYGSFGVDIFFVLSGVVMFESVSRKPQGARAFWINRVFRIAPAYWFMTFLLLALKAAFPVQFAYTGYRVATLLASLFFVPTSNPSGLGEYPTLVVGWTLNFEMFFYTLLAICLCAGRARALALCALALLVAPLVWPAQAPLASVAGSRLLYEFVAGLGVAFLLAHPASRPILLRRRVGSLAACLVLLVLLAPRLADSRACALVSAAALVMAAMLVEPWLRPGSRWIRAMVRLGDESYSTYLVHSLVLGVLLHFTGASLSLPALCATVVLATAAVALCSRLSYRFVEQAGWISALRLRLLRRTNAAEPA